MAAAFSAVKAVRLDCFFVAGSTRTSSAGLTELPQLATITVAGARSGTAMAPKAPRESTTGVTSPPRTGTE